MLFKICMFLLTVKGSVNAANEEVRRLLQTRRIGHGSPAGLGEVPYQVAIKSPSHDSGARKMYITFCGGAIIKPKTVISAAHCFVRGNTYSKGRVHPAYIRDDYAVAGNLRNIAKYSSSDGIRNGQWRHIKQIFFPVTYTFPKDDIAMLRLKSGFSYNKYVSSIPYAKVHKDYGGYDCLASGFGKINDKDNSEVLRKAGLKILAMSTCDKLFEFKTYDMICTTDKISDVLEGDSGGPLVCTNTGDPAENRRGVLVGVVSGGYKGIGSIFTRVSSYKKFVARSKANTWNMKSLLRLIVLISTILIFIL